MRRTAVFLALPLFLVGCAGPALEVSDVRLGRPTGPNAALYFTATGPNDRLLGARTGAATSVELHQTSMAGDGTVAMRPVDGVELADGEPLVLEPGGLHLMLVGVDRLKSGDTIEVVLQWETAGEMTVQAVVVEPSETMGDE